MDFEAALTTELESVTGLSGKVYPLTAPEGEKAPYCTYELISTERQRVLGTNHTGNVDAQYELNIVNSRHSSMKSLKAAIIAKLKTMWGRNLATTGPYIQDINIINDDDMYNNDTSQYIGIVEFIASYDETE